MDPNYDEETDSARRPGTMPIGAAAVAGLFVGLAFGAAAVAVAWTVETRDVDQELAMNAQPHELTNQEREAIWMPKVAEATASMEAMHDKIATLQTELQEKQSRVDVLEADMAKRHDRGVALVKELETARADLAAAKQELAVAIADKDRLSKQLQVTVAELDTQRAATDAAVKTTHESRWDHFLANARLEVCEKGGRNKMSNCRQDVLASLNDEVKADFLHCLRARQEEPALHEADKTQVALPEHARWLDQQERTTRDWYVQLCDPTLPEAPGYAQASPVASPTGVAQGS
jgi:hypothetical protein